MDSRKILIRGSVVLGFVALGFGLYKFFQGQLKAAMNFCYKISGFKVIELSKNRVAFNLDIKFLQNSNFNVLINGYTLDIFINGRKITSVSSATPMNVSYLNAKVDIKPSAVLDTPYLIGLASKALMDKSNFIVKTVGTVNVSTSGISMKAPIDITMSLADILAPTPVGSEDKSLVCKIY